MKFLILVLVLTFASSPSFASPTYPWESFTSKCASLNQNDGKRIGAICPFHDNAANTRGVVVYYFGYLQDGSSYGAPYVNLSLNVFGAERYLRAGMTQVTVGDGRNLPALQVYRAEIVLCGLFTCDSMAQESDFAAYFQAEQKRPTHSPPFEYDNLFEKNYRGHVSLVPNF